MSTTEVVLSNGWKFPYSDQPEYVPADVTHSALELLERWAPVFPKGKTWVGATHNIPSLFVRLDCVYDEDHKLQVFEVEERPCGMGVASQLNPTFKSKLDRLRSEWPSFEWVKDPDRNTDDELWLGEGLSLSEAQQTKELLLVRSRPENERFHELEPRAVSSVSYEGDKNYGVPLGLWRIVNWQKDFSDPENRAGGYIHPSLSGACVLKPVQGTRCRDVVVYMNGGVDLRKVPGKGRIPFYNGQPLVKKQADVLGTEGVERMVRRHEKMVAQPFIMPMRLKGAPELNGILRFYLGYSPVLKSYVPLGGVWAASPALRVHGEEGTTFGPLLYEE